MAEPLKNQFGPKISIQIAKMISEVWKKFPSETFVQNVLNGYEALELKPRAWKIAEALHFFLPQKYEEAIKILMASLGPPLQKTENFGMSPFLYFPHVCFVSKYGLEHFELSLQAQYELTQRFTAEFSIRPFLERYPTETLARLKKWVNDKNPLYPSDKTPPNYPERGKLPLIFVHHLE